MLKSLYIRDYALIDELEVEFSSGFSIITGETGAGKSILVGALKLILGARAQTDTIRAGARKAIVEGVFDVSDVAEVRSLLDEGDFDNETTLILRRELSEGKSRAFINDSPASLNQLRAMGEELVDLHGQHEHQSLLRTEKQVQLVDSFGGLEGIRDDYIGSNQRVAELYRIREELERKEDELRKQREVYEFQIQEIDLLEPQPNEEEALNSERRILENAERLFTATASLFDELYEAEDSVQDRLVRIRNELQDLAQIDEAFAPLQKEIAAAQVVVAESAKSLQGYNSEVEFNPDRLEEIRERLIALDRLKRRYGGTLEAVLELRSDIGEKYAVAVDYEGTLARLDEEISQALHHLSEVAIRQSLKRREVASRIEASILLELEELGMPDAQFEVRFERTQDPEGWILDDADKEDSSIRYKAQSTGVDSVSFFISTNTGEDVRPLARVASGGEVSRIMLALKSILAKSDRLPILIFDEIDMGISGRLAQRVGEKLNALGRYHQILAITHLPQVASLADTHYKIEKSVEGERTFTSIRKLDGTQRTDEIASLISGDKITEAARANAQVLMDLRPASTSTSD
ncbi:MAG: DNA repair protein RecN [Bacteroidetes bacterium]|nr:MAG: DNA repair protein RecN [Bacteroidota bacterium]